MVAAWRIWRAGNNGQAIYDDVFLAFDYVPRDKSANQETLGEDGG